MASPASGDIEHPRAVSQHCPIVSSYLQTVASGQRPLSAAQLLELSAKPYDNNLLQYMKSEAVNAVVPAESVNVDFPLSHYFISSSHNTYLSGSQLYGEASTAPYTQALLRGCRCIEIDVWDGDASATKEAQEGPKKGKVHQVASKLHKALNLRNEKNEKEDLAAIPSADEEDQSLRLPDPWNPNPSTIPLEPRVLHGHTLTKEVSFRSVCNAIRDAAFAKSDMPVIISLEVHTSPSQQEIMVQIIKSCFAGHLVAPVGNDCGVLPTPGSLRRKILIKVKYVDPQEAEKLRKLQTGPSTSVPQTRTSRIESDDLHSKNVSSDDEETNERQRVEGAKAAKPKKSSIIPELSTLGVYTRSYHFSGFSSPNARIPAHVFSLSEKKLVEVHQSAGQDLFDHNRNFLMRAFPSGLRVRSDNLDPGVFWRKGVQMVALNWQRWDEGMMQNEAMFTGSCGYVLKPNGYHGVTLPALASQGPISKHTKPSNDFKDGPSRRKLDLIVTVMAAQDVPLPVPRKETQSFRPYLKVQLHVEKPSERSGERIENDGKIKENDNENKEDDDKFKFTVRPATKGSPDFDLNARRIEFRDVFGVVEEISFLRFKINNDVWGKDALVAWACIRLDRLRPGLRFVHLLDAEGNPSSGVLLVDIEKQLT